ncbi:MAG: cellulase family glycosylhydrolase [Devosia sp.]
MREFSATSAEVKQLADAGVRILRTDLFWDATERARGKYDWSTYDYKLRHLAEQGIRPLLILDYSNPLYTGNANTHVPPRSAAEIEAFAAWATAAVEHFAPLDPIWEIWNEPDIPQFWQTGPAVEEYVALALPACQAIRTASPDATVIGPALAIAPVESNIDSQVFAKLVLRNGPLMQCLDAFSFHPYRDTGPETFLRDMAFYESLADDGKAFTGVERPFVVTEWGYSTYREGDAPKIDEETKAAYLVRQQLVAILAGVPLMISYNWRDRGDDPTNREFNYGVIEENGAPKPSWTALAELTTQLAEHELDNVLSASDGAFVLTFKSVSGDIKVVAWRAEGAGTLTIPGEVPLQITSMYGDEIPVTTGADGSTVSIGRDPIYLTTGASLPDIQIP